MAQINCARCLLPLCRGELLRESLLCSDCEAYLLEIGAGNDDLCNALFDDEGAAAELGRFILEQPHVYGCPE